MMPTNKTTPNNNPYLAALIFFLIIFAVMGIFAVIAGSMDNGGLGDTEGGVGIFGSGTGDGTGGKAGSNTGDGTEAKQGTATKKTPKPEQKSGQGTSAQTEKNSKSKVPAADPVEREKNNTESQDTAVPSANIPKGGPIAELHWESTQEEQSTNAEEESGSSHFSSGGRSVFRVKKHENILFIVDISGSMYGCTAEGLSRLEILKIQLKKTIRSQQQLKSRGKYGIIAFNDQNFYCPGETKRQLRFRSEQDCSTAERWINQMHNLPGSGTSLYPALELAERLIREKKIKVDVIYLLSDGVFGSGSQSYINLLKKMPEGIKVHTICIGASSQLLKDIANAFNGKYEEYR